MLKNQSIVLTGANSGIGLEVLKLLASEKSNKIFAVDLHLDKINEFSENVFSYQCDVSSNENINAFFDAALEAMGDITLFYANAGYPYYEVLNYVDWERTKRIFETNVFSPIYSYEKYQTYLNGREGHFAITISAIGKMAMPGFTLYSATKFATQGFQQGLRLEMPKNIKLTCLYPIATDTNFFKAANKEKFERPFPVQSPVVVAKKMVKGLEKGKKSVSPSRFFSFGMVLFAVLPFIRTIYWNMENAKLKRFLAKQAK
ncbi:MAG: SDR family NAD(P)-dependent oxidoreductase [bacterium]